MISTKVQGAWAIHRAFLQEQAEPLGFFHLTGSAKSILGNESQAIEAAGDAFLNAFVSFRHSLGLPASCLNMDVTEDSFVANECAFLDCLELVLRPGSQRMHIVTGLSQELAHPRAQRKAQPTELINASSLGTYRPMEAQRARHRRRH